MNAFILKIDSTDLASRKTGGLLREKIRDAADQSHQVVVDLRSVRSVSESYADEAFGVLAAERGLDWLVGSVKILANQNVLISIAQAIHERFDSHHLNLRPALQTLVAAKNRRNLRIEA